MRAGDVVVMGSDGRDDVLIPAPYLETSRTAADRVMNEDEYRFVRLVEATGGDLSAIAAALRQGGSELTDDLSLLRLQYG